MILNEIKIDIPCHIIPEWHTFIESMFIVCNSMVNKTSNPGISLESGPKPGPSWIQVLLMSF